MRKRLFAIAVIGALLTAVVGGVGLSGYARLTVANRAEARLATIQAFTLASQALQHKVRALAWFGVAVVGVGRSSVEVRSDGHLVSFDDSDALDACPKLRNRPQGRVSAVCVPVTFMGRSLGVLHTTGPVGRTAAGETLAGLALLGSQSGNRIGTLRSFELAQLQASTDALTGLPNRRAFETAARERLRGGGRLAFVMADLDKFKLLNDAHGHEAGDRALRLFARVLRAGLGKDDLFGRLGGEEFGIVLSDVTVDRAVLVLDRLRAALSEAIDGGTPPFTVSFGVCGNDAQAGFEDLLRTADKALYRAKHEGRDRVVAAAAAHLDRQPRADAQVPVYSPAG